MPREESSYPKDWLRIAEKDLVRMRQARDVGDPDGAGFFLQQSVEKFLKAFLLSKGWKLKRVHDLETLLNESLPYDPDLESFRAACQKISGYYLLERYPFVSESGLSDKDLLDSYQAVLKLIEKLRLIIA